MCAVNGRAEAQKDTVENGGWNNREKGHIVNSRTKPSCNKRLLSYSSIVEIWPGRNVHRFLIKMACPASSAGPGVPMWEWWNFPFLGRVHGRGAFLLRRRGPRAPRFESWDRPQFLEQISCQSMPMPSTRAGTSPAIPNSLVLFLAPTNRRAAWRFYSASLRTRQRGMKSDAARGSASSRQQFVLCSCCIPPRTPLAHDILKSMSRGLQLCMVRLNRFGINLIAHPFPLLHLHLAAIELSASSFALPRPLEADYEDAFS